MYSTQHIMQYLTTAYLYVTQHCTIAPKQSEAAAVKGRGGAASLLPPESIQLLKCCFFFELLDGCHVFNSASEHIFTEGINMFYQSFTEYINMIYLSFTEYLNMFYLSFTKYINIFYLSFTEYITTFEPNHSQSTLTCFKSITRQSHFHSRLQEVGDTISTKWSTDKKGIKY